jgi:K+/H+ antiporter YhaU regulatory subunit KhtT
MTMTEKIVIPRYLKIAVDLATRIVSGEINEGEKLKGRSVLSTEYNVSPETIRRAMSILSDKNVVDVNAGLGIIVKSKEKALAFVKNFKDDESIIEMRKKLSAMFEEEISLNKEILSLTAHIIEMYKFRRSDLISPVEIEVPEKSHIIGKSIGNCEIWHNTGATILGIIHKENIILSPGPYYEFFRGDRLIIVGDENVITRFNSYINGLM